jgi:hypothetical protein
LANIGTHLVKRRECDIAATLRKSFDFTVDRFPLSGPDGLRTPWYGLFRSDTGEPVGSGTVDGNYTPHTKDDVIALVESASTAFGRTAHIKCAFSGGHFVIAEPMVEHRLQVHDNGRGGGDAIWLRLFISAPYGAAGSFQASVGFYRDVCRNLARMRTVPGVSVQVAQVIPLRRSMGELIESFSVLRSGWENLSNAVMRMATRRVHWGEFISAVYEGDIEEPGTPKSLHSTRLEQITQRLEFDRGRTGQGGIGPDGMVSAWDAFNAVQWYAQHAIARPGNPTDVDRIMLALDDQSVLRAEELAVGCS